MTKLQMLLQVVLCCGGTALFLIAPSDMCSATWRAMYGIGQLAIGAGLGIGIGHAASRYFRI